MDLAKAEYARRNKKGWGGEVGLSQRMEYLSTEASDHQFTLPSQQLHNASTSTMMGIGHSLQIYLFAIS